MPIIKSAKKRVRVSNKARARNTATKSALRSSLKSYEKSVTSKKNIADSQAAAHSSLDKAAKKGLVHKNKVARLKRQQAAAAKAAGFKPVKAAKAAKPAAKKAATKKPTAKKAPAKKPATKKK